MRKIFLLLQFFFTVAVWGQESKNLRVLQFNIWQEGTVVPGGFEAIANEIARLKPDLIAFSEVRNYHNTKFNERIVEALAQRGLTYYSFFSNDSGLLSRYPLISYGRVGDDSKFKGTIHKAVVSPSEGKTIAFYTAHLEYTKGANYLPRGYHADTWAKLEAPIVDADAVLANNNSSSRDEAIQIFMEDAAKEISVGHEVILGGDFNEPSYLDWTARTKDKYDHKGLIIPWTITKMLAEGGFQDAFRKVYPDEVTHPGFTFPSYNKDVEISKLVWGASADERDRIDFIFYKSGQRLKPVKAAVVGPKESILRGEKTTEISKDKFILPLAVWPTDHKALLIDFQWK
ncbi:endonuclease/exonuclease/phosphatase family protein [Sphingobacterium spiritivorum]